MVKMVDEKHVEVVSSAMFSAERSLVCTHPQQNK